MYHLTLQESSIFYLLLTLDNLAKFDPNCFFKNNQHPVNCILNLLNCEESSSEVKKECLNVLDSLVYCCKDDQLVILVYNQELILRVN
jgi:hypothetical protein